MPGSALGEDVGVVDGSGVDGIGGGETRGGEDSREFVGEDRNADTDAAGHESAGFDIGGGRGRGDSAADVEERTKRVGMIEKEEKKEHKFCPHDYIGRPGVKGKEKRAQKGEERIRVPIRASKWIRGVVQVT